MREQTYLTHRSEMRRPDIKRGNRSPLLIDQTSNRPGDLTSPPIDQESDRSLLRFSRSPRTDQTNNRGDSGGLLSSGVDDRLSHDSVVSKKVLIKTLKNP
jgi:hypothetical protein